MSVLLERIRRRQPRWLQLELHFAGSRGLRLFLPLEPFETPLAFALALAAWWSRRCLGERGGWRLLFDPPGLGLENIRPDEPVFEVRGGKSHVLLKIGGLF